MKRRLKLTGRRFYNGGLKDGLRVTEVIDALTPKRIMVFVLGRWAYELTELA